MLQVLKRSSLHPLTLSVLASPTMVRSAVDPLLGTGTIGLLLSILLILATRTTCTSIVAACSGATTIATTATLLGVFPSLRRFGSSSFVFPGSLVKKGDRMSR